jgi:hypothetical protein
VHRREVFEAIARGETADLPAATAAADDASEPIDPAAS